MQLTFQTALALLDLEPGYSKEDLKKGFQRASMKYHPDRGGSDAMMKQVNEARAMLEKTSIKPGGFDWDALHAKYKVAAESVVATMKETIYPEAFEHYFSELAGKPINLTSMEWKGTDWTGYRSPSHAGVFLRFESADKKVMFSAQILAYMTDVVDGKTSLGGGESDNAFFPMMVITNFFANNRKQKITQRNFNTQYNLDVLTDPKVIFPKDKVKKGLSNKKTKFTKKDMLLALKTRLDAKEINDTYFLPINDQYFVRLGRMTFRRQAVWTFYGIYERNGIRYTMNSKTKLVSVGESEESFDQIYSLMERLKQCNTPDEMVVEYSTTVESLRS